MDTLLFSSRSILTMVHGIFLGGGGLLAVAAALFARVALRSTPAGVQRIHSLATLTLALVAAVSLLGILINKVAPLE